ncbi:MAG: exodeoxyribonuclease V subunit gamma [Acidobacteriota bacterium]
MAAGFGIYTSNRLEVLVERLAEEMATAPLGPFQRDIVVVQSLGTARWTTLELARRLGVVGGLSTPFPAAFAQWLCRRVLDGEAWIDSEEIPRHVEGSAWSREALVWHLFSVLGSIADASDGGGSDSDEPTVDGATPVGADASLAPVAAYLADDRDQRKRYQLAARLARLIDRYQLYRPRELRSWLAGERPAHDPARWQAELWRRLVARSGEAPFAVRLLKLIETLQTAEEAPPGLPPRLAVFGAPHLPPILVELLAALGRWIPVAIDLVSPTWHFWADLRSEREQTRIARRIAAQDGATGDGVDGEHERSMLPDALHFDVGHPLLATLGRQGRELFDLLSRHDAEGTAWQPLANVEPETGHALGALQHDILHLVERGGVDGEPPWPLDPADRSIDLHVVHSPMREMEVLRDRLLAAFVELPDLRPSDVLVMVTDVALYGPYIQAVFGVENADGVALPFAIADRSAGRERPPSETLLDVLALIGSRVVQSDVFELLDVPALRRRAGLDASDLPFLRRWIDAARVRWGVDGAQRARDFDLPAENQNTWRQGLDRLIAGYATGEVDGLVAGLAPVAGDTVADAEALGRLGVFLDELFTRLDALRAPRSLEAWARDLSAAIDQLFEAGDEAEEQGLQMARDAVQSLRSAIPPHDPSDGPTGDRPPETVELPAVLEHLRGRLEQPGFGSGFFDGRITFCALQPMRALPFRVLAVCGLDDGAFPRRDADRTFDLTVLDRRLGDRSSRDDDRYLFLETLLAARERLLLSYVGRSQRDATELEPSSVLVELFETLDRTFDAGDGRPARDALTTVHRLQPWSAAYFDPASPRLETFSREQHSAARASLAERRSLPPFLAQPAPGDDTLGNDALHAETPAAAEPMETSPSELIRFWRLPCRTWCRDARGLFLDPPPVADEEVEPFRLDGLDAYLVRADLLDRQLRAPADDSHTFEALRAGGQLPTGGLGRSEVQSLSARIEAFVERLEDVIGGAAADLDESPSVEIDGRFADGGAWTVAGRLSARRLDAETLVRCRAARIQPLDRLAGWIELLLASATGEASTMLVVGDGETLRLRAPETPRIEVDDLLEGLHHGLREPLPVFARASFAHEEARRRAQRSQRARPPIEAARKAWEGDRWSGRRGDADEPHVQLVFRGRDPLADPAFATWAEQLWSPFFDHLESEDTA